MRIRRTRGEVEPPSPCPSKSGNNAPLLSDNIARRLAWLLNDGRRLGTVGTMKHTAYILIAALGLMATPLAAQAACLVEYKAKQDDPLRLSVGTIEVASCEPAQAEAEARAALAQQGWTLLKILSIKG